MRRTYGIAVIAALGLASAVLLPAGAGGAAVPMLSGSFVGVDGAKEAGATITVTAWPNGANLDREAIGAVVPTRTVQVVRTNAAGSYSLSPDLATLPASYREPDGTVNLDIDARSARTGDSQDWSFAAAETGSAVLAVNPNVLATGRGHAKVSFNLNKATIASSLNGGAETTATSPTTAQAKPGADSYNGTNEATAGATPQDNPPKIYDYCVGGWLNVKFYPNRQEKFFNLYTYGRADVEENIGTSHTLGVGVAVTGGGWSASGTHTIENSDSVFGGDSFTRNYQLSNHVNYHHYDEQCFKAVTGASYFKHKVQATSVFSLLDTRTPIVNRSWNLGNCRPYYSGHHGKSSGSNEVFSAGVSAPFLNLSADVAYSKATTVTWYPPKKGEELCGSTDQGFGDAPAAGGEAIPATGCGGSGANGRIPAEVDVAAASAARPNC